MMHIVERPDVLALLMVGFILVYLIVTLRLLRRKPSLLWFPALFVAICGFALFWKAYGVSGVPNWLSRLVLSVVGALNLFLFNAISTFGRLFNYFYVTESMTGTAEAVQSHLILLESLLVCASWTTSILTVHFFARRLSSRLWLLFHHPSGKRCHIFFDDGSRSLMLASDFAKSAGNQIIFVLFPGQDNLPSKLSFLQVIRGIRPDTVRMGRIHKQVPGSVILSARQTLKECQGDYFFNEAGLARLSKWVKSDTTSMYFLSDDGETNLSVVLKLPASSAKFYCRADRGSVNDSITMAFPHEIHLIDESFLTIKQMKMDDRFAPVHFVDKAVDEAGKPTGWVRSGFRSMILGFGNTGRGILSYLYEFGVFVGEDKKPVPFSCDVIDHDAASSGGRFRIQHPAVSSEKVRFLAMEVGSSEFWHHLSAGIATLNYIAIALGDDQQNVRLAIDVMELVRSADIKRCPAIVVKLDEPGKYKRLIDFYTQNLGLDCILVLGGLDVWKESSIIDERFERYARVFYDAYCRASQETVPWEDRIRRIENAGNSTLWKKLELSRKTGQDYSDYMHVRVKEALCPDWLYKDLRYAASIPAVFAGTHCDDVEAAPVLEYLAIGEHLRWLASHEIEGYRHGPEKLEDLKIHPAMQDYWALSEPVRHFDWIVVKTTLQLLHQGL